MTKEARLDSLKRKHKELHDKIEALEGEKAPDDFITPLKIKKLTVKDEMQTIISGNLR